MSNINRSRVNKKPCPFCAATVRDSNGQCHCRNVLYRLTHQPNLTEKQIEDIKKTYNKAVANGSVEEARLAAKPVKATKAEKKATKKAAKVAVSEPETEPEPQPAPEAEFVVQTDETEQVPAVPVEDTVVVLTPEAEVIAEVKHGVVAGDTPVCVCGFAGKGTLPSVRSHVAREARLAREAG